MDNETLQSEEILKKESIGYLKSAINLQQGNLILTNKRLVLDSHKTTVGGGLLGNLLKNMVEKDKIVFDLGFTDILSIANGKIGIRKGVLEITDKQNKTYRIIVKNYEEWEEALKKFSANL